MLLLCGSLSVLVIKEDLEAVFVSVAKKLSCNGALESVCVKECVCECVCECACVCVRVYLFTIL